ncbi:MAG TPA: M20/M25/M40 family metallo-hydrolase [Candidatus Acidoferrales bacterium]|nr:M20/M25/M40 family metallo-hydrolase [Candidatus Acidoferrales bacterium]
MFTFIGVGLIFFALLPYPAQAQKSSAASPGAVPPAQVAQEVRAYRLANEDRIVREFAELLAIPNVATDSENIQRNAAKLIEMLEARGIETHPLTVAGRGPVIFGKLTTPEATRTVIFYAHYDGQPVDAKAWTESGPFEPTLRSNAFEAGGKRIPFPTPAGNEPSAYADDWRIYARSASDDKAPIVALLAALDALRARKIPLGVNLKVILEGEEEAGSPNLERVLLAHRNLLAGDLLICADGPAHQSGKPLINFGNRGEVDAQITVYGPVRALHSGHYGNWAPNPAFELARLLASMKDADGRVLIAGFYDDVMPLGAAEKKALAEMPDNDAELMRELQFAKPEGGGKKLVELLNLPSLNIRGLRSAYVGEQSQNVVPDKAEASIDMRLVKNIDPKRQFERLVEHIRKQGFYVTDREPTREERLKYPQIAKVVYGGGYPASRTPMDLPAARKLAEVVEGAAGPTVKMPTMGGSVPMYIFENLGLPVIGVPIVNYDNHQHSSDENLRLGHLWRGIEIFAAILADLTW